MSVIEEIPNNKAQDKTFEPNSKGKARGKGKIIFLCVVFAPSHFKKEILN